MDASKASGRRAMVSRAHNSTPVSTKKARTGTERLRPYRFQPGISGKPKIDLAAELARSIFEEDGEAIKAASLRKVHLMRSKCLVTEHSEVERNARD